MSGWTDQLPSSAVPSGTCLIHGPHGFLSCPTCSTTAVPLTPAVWPAELERPDPAVLLAELERRVQRLEQRADRLVAELLRVLSEL